MKYTEYQYQRPPIAEYNAKIDQLTAKLSECESAKEQLNIYHQVVEITDEIGTASAYVVTRSRGNTADEFYKEQ